MTGVAVAILAFVTLERLIELVVANRNSRRLLAQGAVEHGAGHYPLIVGLHAAWLAALWWFAPGRPIELVWLGLFALLQVARIWVIATLGSRWTTRIIVLPNAPLVRRGPYRLIKHPNYAIVVLEISSLPLAFGLWGLALAFTLLNAILLAVRMRKENEALRLAAISSP